MFIAAGLLKVVSRANFGRNSSVLTARKTIFAILNLSLLRSWYFARKQLKLHFVFFLVICSTDAWLRLQHYVKEFGQQLLFYCPLSGPNIRVAHPNSCDGENFTSPSHFCFLDLTILQLLIRQLAVVMPPVTTAKSHPLPIVSLTSSTTSILSVSVRRQLIPCYLHIQLGLFIVVT